mgnify:FL=1
MVKVFPNTKIMGVDAYSYGEWDDFKKNSNVSFTTVRAENMFLGQESIFDVVYCSALMIMLKPGLQVPAIKAMLRVAKEGVIFIETHMGLEIKMFKEYFPGRTYTDFIKLFKELKFTNYTMDKISSEVWPGFPWTERGFVIKGRLKEYKQKHAKKKN